MVNCKQTSLILDLSEKLAMQQGKDTEIGGVWANWKLPDTFKEQ